jgi:hypothetical protein
MNDVTRDCALLMTKARTKVHSRTHTPLYLSRVCLPELPRPVFETSVNLSVPELVTRYVCRGFLIDSSVPELVAGSVPVFPFSFGVAAPPSPPAALPVSGLAGLVAVVYCLGCVANGKCRWTEPALVSLLQAVDANVRTATLLNSAAVAVPLAADPESDALCRRSIWFHVEGLSAWEALYQMPAVVVAVCQGSCCDPLGHWLPVSSVRSSRNWDRMFCTWVKVGHALSMMVTAPGVSRAPGGV